MQSENFEFELPSTPRLGNLDFALHRLGMPATPSESRRDYVEEIRRKSYKNVMQINTRYVRNVDIGFRVRPLLPNVRYNPYAPRRQRHRTKSENNDNGDEKSAEKGVPSMSELADNVVNELKKAKSLESIVAEGGGTLGKELEVVSSCIENLRVAE